MTRKDGGNSNYGKVPCRACGTSMTEKYLCRTGETKGEEGTTKVGSASMQMVSHRCPLCGNEWKWIQKVFEEREARKLDLPEGLCRITYLHRKGRNPTLRRVSDFPHLAVSGACNEKVAHAEEERSRGGSRPSLLGIALSGRSSKNGSWDHYIGPTRVGIAKWRKERRKQERGLRKEVSN